MFILRVSLFCLNVFDDCWLATEFISNFLAWYVKPFLVCSSLLFQCRRDEQFSDHELMHSLTHINVSYGKKN